MTLPSGLPNLGATCWLNSVLQVLIHSIHLREIIESNSDKGKLHSLLTNLLQAVDTHDALKIIGCYRPLHQHIVQSNPIFSMSALNDSHEVMTYLINELHKEAGVVIPDQMMTQLTDPVSKVILRDFDKKISKILEACITVTERTISDKTTVNETFVTMFVEPKLMSEHQAPSLQEALNDIKFGNLPKCFFINLIMSHPCGVPDALLVQQVWYQLRCIVFFLPHAIHYICTVRGELDGKSVWCILNDASVSFVSMEDMAKTNLGVPSLILYEQSKPQV